LQPFTIAKRVWLLLFFAIVALYLYGLGSLPLVGPDEPRYAQVAREMFLRHDLITPTLDGHTWFEKPALLYWMMIGSFRLFGVSEWAARLGPAIAGLLTIVAIAWICSRLEPQQTREPRSSSFFSTLVIASSGGLIVFSRAASFDIVVTMTITWAFSFFLAYQLEEKKRNSFLGGFYVFVGLSLLAKGLIGFVIPFGVIGAFFLIRRRLPERALIMSLVWGLPLAVAVSALWYGPVIARHGWPFVDQFFIQHHFARYFSNKYQHPQPIYFYLPVMLMLALPWTPFLIDSLIGTSKWQLNGPDVGNKTRVFALAWLVVPIVFFSFSGSKLPAYILPSLPAVALLISDRLTAFVTHRSQTGKSSGALTMRLTGAMLLLLAAGGLVYVRQTGKVSMECALLISLPVVAAGVFAVFVERRRFLTVILIGLVAPLGSLVALSCAVDRFAPRESVRELIKLSDARGYGFAPVFMFSRIERTAEFYASGRVVYGPDGDPRTLRNAAEVVQQARRTPTPFLLLVPLGSLSQLNPIAEI